MLRCSELGLVLDEVLSSYTTGMVYDMLIERDNDRVKYPDLATQQDMDRF